MRESIWYNFPEPHFTKEANPFMNKMDIVAAVTKEAGITRKAADAAVAAVFNSLVDSLATGEKVMVAGFGSFEVRNRPARVARNPRTGDQINIEASKAPVFKAGKALKDSVNK